MVVGIPVFFDKKACPPHSFPWKCRTTCRIRFGKADLVSYSPVTEKHAGAPGMTLAEICEAAITLSDNTAGNLLLDAIGGPKGWTAYARSLGDDISRLDRRETILNEAIPGDPRDTTTPSAMLRNLQAVLLGNALNLLSLAAIAFTAVTRQRDLYGLFNRAIWVVAASLVLSGFFISYGEVSPDGQVPSNALYLPLVSYLIMLASNIYLIRQLSLTDAGHEQVEVAPVAWRAAIVGALTGLIPLVIILVFVLLEPLPWAAGNSLFLRIFIPLVIAFVGAPTPGAMMAVWLSHKMSFPILIRTSALAGLLMFLAAYLLVVLLGLLTGTIFSTNFGQQMQPVALIITGALLALVGFLRGQLDAWVYHRVLLRRRP